jgi:hypothetical protein
MIDTFWDGMQVEMLDRDPWRTRIERASPIHDYIEHLHNTRRRQSALGMSRRPRSKPATARLGDERERLKTALRVLVDERLPARLSGARL